MLLQDLKQADPEVGKSMQQILEFEGDVGLLALSFEVEYDNFGMLETHELKPGGSSIAVTNANRVEYVDLYVQWWLVSSIDHQFFAFNQGFRQVCHHRPWKLAVLQFTCVTWCGAIHACAH